MDSYNIYLIGFMGTGKSTIASAFSEMQKMKIVEMDDVISEKAGMSIKSIFSEYGEEYFRNLETKLLKEIVQMENVIVSCGGGVVLRQENISMMKDTGTIVHLSAKPEEILRRVKNDNKRPLLQGSKNVESKESLMKTRNTSYENAADFTIHTDGKSKEVICEEIIKELQRMKESEENV